MAVIHLPDNGLADRWWPPFVGWPGWPTPIVKTFTLNDPLEVEGSNTQGIPCPDGAAGDLVVVTLSGRMLSTIAGLSDPGATFEMVGSAGWTISPTLTCQSFSGTASEYYHDRLIVAWRYWDAGSPTLTATVGGYWRYIVGGGVVNRGAEFRAALLRNTDGGQLAVLGTEYIEVGLDDAYTGPYPGALPPSGTAWGLNIASPRVWTGSRIAPDVTSGEWASSGFLADISAPLGAAWVLTADPISPSTSSGYTTTPSVDRWGLTASLALGPARGGGFTVGMPLGATGIRVG